MTNTYIYEDLVQLNERLQPVKNFLQQNSYIKSTTNKLKRLMNDVETTTTILLLGKERVGKTATINSYLGRNILASSLKNPTKVNTFLKYGEVEYINAIFLDGVEITFDLNKLPLLTISELESAQVIREHIDYIEIYLNHKSLQNVTLIDSIAIESDFNGSAYFSQIMLERVDEIFWLIRAGSPLTEAELDLLKKVSEEKTKPYIVVNGIDAYEGNIQSFIDQEALRYGEYVQSFITISAKQAMEAARENDSQKLIDSNFTQFRQLIEKIAIENTKKVDNTIQRFVNWLELFNMEMKRIPNREPFMSAATNIVQFNRDHNNGTTKEERDRAIIQAYRQEYKEVSEVFKNVETLYQLLQKLASTFYLRDQKIEQFEEIAFAYQQNVRDYRKKHTEYMQMYTRVEEQYRKSFKKYLQQWSPTETNEQITSQIENLKKMYEELKKLDSNITQQQKTLLQHFYKTQNHLMELAKKRMEYIIRQLAELDNKRKVELAYLKSYNEKIKEFTCIESAQRFLLEAVKPYILNEFKSIDEPLKKKLSELFTELEELQMTLPSVEDEEVFNQPIKQFEHIDFESEYVLTALSLTEGDIISEIPALPTTI